MSLEEDELLATLVLLFVFKSEPDAVADDMFAAEPKIKGNSLSR